jgi:peptidoglycan hydrolase-like protein with peptidoglycan-binding domain
MILQERYHNHIREYSNMTKQEIIALQNELGVTPDGIIGPQTRAAAAAKIQGSVSIAEAQAQSEKFGDVAGTTGLVYGSDAQPATNNAPVESNDNETSTALTAAQQALLDAEAATTKRINDLLAQLNQQQTQYPPPGGASGPAFETETQSYTPTLGDAQALFPYFPGNILNIILDSWVDSGSIDLAIAQGRASEDYAKTFPGIKREDGSLRMTEIQYLEVKDAMADSLRNYNLNPDIFQNEIIDAIQGDVDIQEFQGRLQFGYEQLINNRDVVLEVYRAEYGMDLTEEALFAMFISPEIATSVLENQILVSQILAEAEVADITLGKSTVQDFISAGISQEQARGLFRETEQLSGLTGVAAQMGQDLSEEDIASGLAGLSPEQLGLIKSAEARSASQSAVQAGAATTQAGQVTGLVEE